MLNLIRIRDDTTVLYIPLLFVYLILIPVFLFFSLWSDNLQLKGCAGKEYKLMWSIHHSSLIKIDQMVMDRTPDVVYVRMDHESHYVSARNNEPLFGLEAILLFFTLLLLLRLSWYLKRGKMVFERLNRGLIWHLMSTFCKYLNYIPRSKTKIVDSIRLRRFKNTFL
jgi:hypothetical protein